MDIQDTKEQRQAFELVVANKLQNSLYHSVFFNEATGWYYCADDAPAGVQVFCCDLNSDFRIWQAAKAQAVQSKQGLLDRVNARWQLAHEQCAENWNTYSSAQMDAFDWVEQDINELLGETQEPAND